MLGCGWWCGGRHCRHGVVAAVVVGVVYAVGVVLCVGVGAAVAIIVNIVVTV